MRLLYVVNGYKPAFRVGGPPVSVSATAEALVARGHEVTVFTSSSNLGESIDIPLDCAVDIDGVEVWFFDRWEPGWAAPESLRNAFRNSNYLYAPSVLPVLETRISEFDLVHTHVPFNYLSRVCGQAALRHQKPLFYHQRAAFHPEYLKFRRMKKLAYINLVERPIMNRATTLIALTEAEVGYFRDLGVTTHCEVLPNGINPELFLPDGSKEDSSSWIPGSDKFVILFMARLHQIKGPSLLVEAFAAVAAEYGEAVLILAGPDEHGLTPSLRDFAKERGIGERVLFPGMVSGERKRALLARADMFCLPSAAEGHSMAILEALASGTPVIITPGCEFPEVESRGAGWVVERRISSWVGALREAMRDQRLWASKKESALDLVRDKYSWEHVGCQLERIYAEGIRRNSEHQPRNI